MDTRAILKTAWFTPGPRHRWGLPILMEGPPGSAKTSVTENTAHAFALWCETVIASIREPADFLGLPIPHETEIEKVKQLVVEYAASTWARRLAERGRGVAFLDELNTAPPAVQAALLRVVLDGAVGDLQLPAGVRFVAAQNAVEQAAGGHDLAMPLANRFVHWQWEVLPVDIWTDWLLSSGGNGGEGSAVLDPAKEEQRVEKAWPEPWAKARGLIAGFMRRRPTLLSQLPKIGDPAASKAFPTPRTWELACRAMAGSEVHDLGEVERDLLISGCVGTGPASELVTYLRETDLPDPSDILDGKAKFKADARLDRTLAVFSACAALVTPPKAERRKERNAKLWEILGEHVKDAADVVEPAARALVRAGLSAGCREAIPTLARLKPILDAAGIRA